MTKGSGSGVPRVRIRSKVTKCWVSEAPGAQAAPGSLDLGLSNTYPGSPLTGPGYRARTAEDTGTEGQLRCPGTLPPAASSGPEPRAPFLRGVAPSPLLPVRYRVRGSGQRVPRTGRYGPSGPPRALLPGVHHPPPTQYYVIFLSVLPVVTDLACLPVVVTTRPLQGRPLQLLLGQLRS